MGLILFVGAFVVSFIQMRKVLATLPEQETSEEPLTKSEKIWAWVLCFLSPLAAGTAFYYGWRKRLPQKAKQANTISWLALFLRVGVSLVLAIPYLVSKSK